MITEGIKYTNHLGEVFEFGTHNAWIDESALHNYSWDYEVSAKKIHSLKRASKAFSLPCKLIAKTEEEAIANKNALTDLTEKDVVAGQMGKLSIGDWYIYCYVLSSSKSAYLYDKRYLETNLFVASPGGAWVQAHEYNFFHRSTEVGGFDYSHDWNLDYGEGLAEKIFVEYDGTPFKITIYGADTDPYVSIGNQTYRVHKPLQEGERIEIDSLERTVIHYGVYGEPTNVFGLRDKTNYIFEPLVHGEHAVVWDGANEVSITTYRERSEPEWT